jgi:hypothetical protein
MPDHFLGRTITQVAVNQAAAGSTDVVAAPGDGLKIYVVTICLLNSHSAVGTLVFNEGTGPTALSGQMQLAVGGGIVLVGDPQPVLQTNTANSKLTVTTTTAFVDGYIRYFVAA